MERQGRPVLGREAELASIDAWLAQVPGAGKAGLLVIAGDPGIGKTTLWGEATRRASAIGCQVLSSRPVPSDAGLPHVVLADLLRTVPEDALRSLPARRAGLWRWRCCGRIPAKATSTRAPSAAV